MIIALLFIVGLYFLWRITSFHPTDISLFEWKQTPNLIAVLDAQQGQESGILFIRLRDGKEQFIAGQWDANFTDDGGAYAFGTFPKVGYSKQLGQQLYFLNQERIFDITLANATGVLTTIQENPAHTFMMLEFSEGNNTLYCLAERIQEGTLECDQISVSGGQAVWNPEKDHEAVIQNTINEIFTFDPAESAPHFVDPEKESERYKQLQALLQKKFDANVYYGRILQKKLKKVGPLMLILGENSMDVFRVPWFSQAAFLSDGEHVILKQRDSLNIFELPTKKKVELIRMPDLEQKKVKFRNMFFDITLL